jgi:hypothetical protein
LVAAIVIATSPVPAGGHRSHRGPSGVAGTVLNTSCPGPCPTATAPPYTGDVTVAVRRVSDGTLIATAKPTAGRFRIRVRHGRYDVTATVPVTPPCGPSPVGAKIVCPMASSAIATCPATGDSARVAVHRHRFTQVELHVQNACIVTPQ